MPASGWFLRSDQGILKLWQRLFGGRGDAADDPLAALPVERPWRQRWDHLPKRSAGTDFRPSDYAEARARARDVARATLGPALWAELQRQG